MDWFYLLHSGFGLSIRAGWLKFVLFENPDAAEQVLRGAVLDWSVSEKILQSFLLRTGSFAERYETALLSKNQKKENAQIGIRIRVAAVTGLHDRPLHYLGKITLQS